MDDHSHLSPFTVPKACGSDTAVEVLGPLARLISSSKSGYRRQHPGRVVFFNARVFNGDGDEIWSGDLDLTASQEALFDLAARIGPIAATPEYPYWQQGLPDDFAGFASADAADECAQADAVFIFDASDRQRCLARLAREEEAQRAHWTSS